MLKSSENIENRGLKVLNLDGKKNMIFMPEMVDAKQHSVKIKTTMYTKYCINKGQIISCYLMEVKE